MTDAPMTDGAVPPKAMAAAAADTERLLATLLPDAGNRLGAAMRHAVLNGGKRLRPFLLLESAALFGVSRDHALRAAAALEMVHCFSLVHDDLPAMDDDDLRRGKPTVHVAFDEATAILAGDALFSLAFEVLADPGTHPDAALRNTMAASLSHAAGAMITGQMLDMEAEVKPFDREQIIELQRHKTGALFIFACEVGAVLGSAGEAERDSLIAYARDFGLAFQIADDLLDAVGDTATLGKAANKDAAAGKATFVSVLGIEEARREAHCYAESAADSLSGFGAAADNLRELARFAIARDY